MRTAIRRLNNRLRRAHRNHKTGSVLILVVALLVLMALIGTAFISTSRVDRVTSVQNVNNTQIELLVEGVKYMAKAAIVGDILDPSTSPRLRNPASPKFSDWTMPLLVDPGDEANDNIQSDYATNCVVTGTANPIVGKSAYLSPRLPIWDPNAYILPSAYWLPASATALAGLNQTGAPVWPVLGAPLISSRGQVVNATGTGSISPNQSLFESPFVLDPTTGSTPVLTSVVPFTYHNRITQSLLKSCNTGTPQLPSSDLVPFSTTINYADGTTQSVPVWLVNVWNPATSSLKQFYYLAGDADGDGVADCGMWKLPVGQINGVTYYAGERIIENNSTINPNTAFSRDMDFNGVGSLTVPHDANHAAAVGMFNLGMFPSNVGLAEFLKTYTTPPPNTVALYNLGVQSLDISGNVVGTCAGEFGGVSTYLDHLTVGGGSLTNGGTYGVGGIVTNIQPGSISYTKSVVAPPYTYTVTSPMGTLTLSGGSGANTPVYYDTTNGNNPTPRSDFAYTGWQDAQWMQVGRRTNSPGQVFDINTGTTTQCRTFDVTDEISLAYHFVMANPNLSLSNLEQQCIVGTNNAGSIASSTGVISSNLQDSLYFSSPSQLPGNVIGNYLTSDKTAYNVSASTLSVAKWYSDNFDYAGNVGTTFFSGGNYYYSALPHTGGRSQAVPPPENELDAMNTYRCRRTLLSTYNPVTIQSPNISPTLSFNKFVVGNSPTPPYTQTDLMSDPGSLNIPKTSINAAAFDDLWRAFFKTMAADSPATVTPFGATAVPANMYVGMQFTQPAPSTPATTVDQSSTAFTTDGSQYHPQRMFRNSYRDMSPTGTATFQYFAPDQMVVLRSALAAANAEGMRDPFLNCGSLSTGSHTFPLQMVRSGVPVPVDVTVYTPTRQPYIMEVYANTNILTQDGTGGGTANQKPYMALSLVNPYPDPIDISGWKVVLLDRHSGSAQLNAGTLTAQIDNTTQIVIPPGTIVPASTNNSPGLALLENFNAASPDANLLHRPQSTGLNDAIVAGAFYVPNLDKAIDNDHSTPFAQEVVLMRPITNPATNAIVDYAPADSYDFTGLNAYDDKQASKAHTWHYVRGKAIAWRFIYPGRYDASLQMPDTTTQVEDGQHPRHEGTQVGEYLPTSANQPDQVDPFISATTDAPITIGKTTPPTHASYPAEFPFQFLNIDQPGPMAQLFGSPTTPSPVPPTAFPFGMFARDTDILQVPYCGSYKVTTPGLTPGADQWAGSAGPLNNVIELNAMPIDAAMCEDTDTEDDASDATQPTDWCESVGRFVPILDLYNSGILASINDFVAKPAYGANANNAPGLSNTRYHWALRLFDFFTTQSPTAAYFPDVVPNLYGPYVGTTPTAPSPVDISTATTGIAGPVQGKININTASWRVLSTLRLNTRPTDPGAKTNNYTYTMDASNTELTLTAGADPRGDDDNVKLAKLIAYYRDGHTFGAADSDNPSGVVFSIPPHGPYQSITSVLQLKGIQSYVRDLAVIPTNPGNVPDDVQGAFSPFNATVNTGGTYNTSFTDGVTGDYASRFSLINALANTTTTRSDTFTVYIVVQGWRNAGSTDAANPPKLVVQRRAAFLADRSAVTSTNSDLKITTIPTD